MFFGGSVFLCLGRFSDGGKIGVLVSEGDGLWKEGDMLGVY